MINRYCTKHLDSKVEMDVEDVVKMMYMTPCVVQFHT